MIGPSTGVDGMADERLILFTRFPELGKVKTRLAASIGDRPALEVHRELAERAISEAKGWGGELEIWISGGEPDDWEAWQGPQQFVEQEGEDLGARLARAVKVAFDEGVRRLVVMGTDCPGLDRSRLKAAFSQLESCPVVFGPALDGGYYLVGLSAPRLDLFEGIEWGGSEVLKQSLVKAPDATLLEPLADVDVEADLHAWKRG